MKNKYEISINGKELKIRRTNIRQLSFLEIDAPWIRRVTQLKVRQDEIESNKFHIYESQFGGYKLTYWNTVVVDENFDYQEDRDYKIIQDDPSNRHRAKYIEKEFTGYNFEEIKVRDLSLIRIEKIIDKLDLREKIEKSKFDIEDIKTIEKISFITGNEWTILGAEQEILTIFEANENTEKLFAAIEAAQESIRCGMTDYEAQNYYLAPLKEVM